jgi:hypothetical protein
VVQQPCLSSLKRHFETTEGERKKSRELSS